MATANFAARKQPKLDFGRFWTVWFEECSFSERSPLPLFKVPVSESVWPSMDLWREVAGKRDLINYGRPVNGWGADLKNGLFIY